MSNKSQSILSAIKRQPKQKFKLKETLKYTERRTNKYINKKINKQKKIYQYFLSAKQ